MKDRGPDKQARLTLSTQPDGSLRLWLSGDWTRHFPLPSRQPIQQALVPPSAVRTLYFDTHDLGHWDSLLVLFVVEVQDLARQVGAKVVADGLPPGVQRLLALRSADAGAEAGKNALPTNVGLLARVGQSAADGWRNAVALLAFGGELVLAGIRVLRGRGSFRASDLWRFIQHSGVDALPIISLISVLVGMILAFVGAFQLALFGTEVYIANLVGIGMTREMGAMMAAIIMAGRTGAAFAAQLGAMQANEEIDALRTLGLSPLEFLVLPRMLALVLMLPLLVAYADLLGILGGMLVGTTMFDIAPLQYLEQTRAAISPVDIIIGLVKGLAFGVVVSVSGCFQGLHSERSSEGVGGAATAAVVMAIVGIVVVDSVITLITTLLRI